MQVSFERQPGWQILYTGFAAGSWFLRLLTRTGPRESMRKANAFVRRILNYSPFCGLFEAQRLGEVLPFIRAHRPKLPHPVYEMRDYRMRRAAGICSAGTASEFPG
jgi:hypothetical protein